MIQYTTPTIKIVAHGADLTPYTVRVTIKQSSTKVSVDATDMSYDSEADETTLNVPLTVTQNGTYAESGKAYSPVTVNVSGGGGSVSVDQVTWTNNSTSTVSHQFTGLKGTPKFAVLRCTAQLTRSSSNTYYYIADIVWDGTNAWGNYHLRSNGTFNNVAKDAASGFNVTVSGSSITFSSDATSRSSAPGSFYNSTYELTYVY